METLTVNVDFGLLGGPFAQVNAFQQNMFSAAGWANVLADTRTQDPIVCEYGILSADPTERVAGAGSLSFSLDNSKSNTAQTLGWYSPLNAIKRGGFDFNIPTRLTLRSPNVGANAAHYKFRGNLADIDVVPGEHEERLVRCTALDLMDDYARIPVPPLDVQFDKRDDQLFQAVINALPAALQPPLRAIETGLDTYPVAFDRAREEAMTVRELLHEICMSGLAKTWFVGTTAGEGGLLTFRNRQYAARNTTVLVTLNADIARGGLAVQSSRDDLISQVQVFVRPTRIDATANTILYDLQTTSVLVGPGQTNRSLFGPFRDPANPGDSVGGTDMVQPVAVTDYQMNAQEDGSGADLTANFSVLANYTGSGVHFEITNNGGTAGYVTQLRCRGRGIYRFLAMIEREVPSVAFGHRVLQIDMPYQHSANVGESTADYLANILARPLARVQSVTFLANASAALMGFALGLEPGSRIAITETVTGLNATQFTINGVRLEIRPAKQTPLLWCTWYLEPADTQQYWFAGQVGASEAGINTRAGF